MLAGLSMKKTTVPLSVSVTDWLKKKIILGEMEPGEWLREEHIAKEIGVSRIPLREALKNLESDGYVTNIPFRGAVVKERSIEEIIEALDLMDLLVPVLLKAAIANYTEEDLAKLETIYDDMDGWSKQDSFLKMTHEMTELMYKPAKKDYTLNLIKELYVKSFTTFKMLFVNNTKTIEALQKQAKDFVELIRSGRHEEALKGRVKSIKNSTSKIRETLQVLAPV